MITPSHDDQMPAYDLWPSTPPPWDDVFPDLEANFLEMSGHAKAYAPETTSEALAEPTEKAAPAPDPVALDPSWIDRIRDKVMEKLVGAGNPALSVSKTTNEPLYTRLASGMFMLDVKPTEYASDCSWTTVEDEDTEDYYSQLRLALEQLRGDEDVDYLLTSALPSRHRRQVHAFSRLMGLSHMSFGTESLRKVLISKYRISRPWTQLSERCWNPKTVMKEGEIDLRVIGITSVPCMTWEVLGTSLRLSGLPLPSNATCAALKGQINDVLIALFDTAAHAAKVMAAIPELGFQTPVTANYIINQSRLQWSSMAWQYTNMGSHLVKLGTPATPPLPTTSSNAAHKDLSEEPKSHQSSQQAGLGDYSSALSQSDMRTLKAWRQTSRVPQPVTPARSNSTSLGSGFNSDTWTSDASNGSFSTSAMSNDDMPPEFPTVRRRRFPKSKDHYLCRAPDCERTFDRAGDRKKHERIHQQPHTWPHGCEECGKRFIDKKDLVRHAKSCA